MTVDMMMSKGMKMKGMKGMQAGHDGARDRNPQQGCMATVTLPAKDVLKMHLMIIYSGDSKLHDELGFSPVITRCEPQGDSRRRAWAP